MIPTTYELDAHGEASGVVYHYCSAECQGKHRHELESQNTRFQEVEEPDDTWMDMCDEEVCAECDAPLIDNSEQLVPDHAMRAAADRIHGREGECEIDDGAKISRGSEPGAYVQAWVWVDFMDVKPEDYHDPWFPKRAKE